jgi:CheY-like chemotaxis protein/HPt (histidine-containing phosphotransfer) domain-containing protein
MKENKDDQQAQSGDIPEFSGNILVAEDSKLNQILIKKLLEKHGLTVTIVEDGAEAVGAATKDDFDIILMDIQMPVMNGYEATEMLKKTNIKTPIVALTANAMNGDDKKCFDAGFDEYMSKPIKRDKLVEVLEKYLHERDESVMNEIDEAKEQIDQIGRMCEDVVKNGSQKPTGECPIDWDFVMETCGEEEIVKAIADSFLSDSPGVLKFLRSAIDGGNSKEILLYSHKMKGSALNLGARKLADKAAPIEDAGDNGDVKTAGQLLGAMITEFDKVIAFLSEKGWVEKAKRYSKS